MDGIFLSKFNREPSITLNRHEDEVIVSQFPAKVKGFVQITVHTSFFLSFGIYVTGITKRKKI